jgi:uncharacterized integral membrane protein
MRKFFTTLIVVPLGLLFVVFAVANRHFVTVSFDPFNSIDPSISLSLPLFVLIILIAIIGVVAGGTATWFGQRHWRKAARQNEADARAAREQLIDLRAAAIGARGEPQRLPYPSLGTTRGASGRDKQGATL